MTSASCVSLTVSPEDPRIARIRFERPEQRNAINTAMADAFRAALSTFEADPALRVAVLSGAGPVFCAGMDLAAFAAGERPGLNREDADGFAHFVRRRRQKPVIAAVRGGAFAGGFEIMLACDLVIAAADARFGVPEAKRGLIAGGGGAARLPARIPLAVAREMLLTGDPISAARAYALGLVNGVTEPDRVEAEAEALAGRIADNAPLAVAAALAVTNAVAEAGEAAGWAETARAWEPVSASADAREGALAFKEKRAPVWRNR